MREDEIRTYLRSHGWTYQPDASPEQVRREGTRRHRRAGLTRGLIAACVALAIGGMMYQWLWRSGIDQPDASPLAAFGPVITHREARVLMTAELSSTEPLELRDGCVLFAGNVVVWPADAEWSEKEHAVAFTENGKHIIVPIGDHLPAGLGGGVIPFEYASLHMDKEAQSRAQTCLDLVQGDNVVFVN